MPIIDKLKPNIEELKIGQYKVVIVDAKEGTSQDLSQICSSIQWDYDLDQPAEHYQLTFVHTSNISNRIKPGDRVKLYGYAIRPYGSNIEIYWELLKRIYIAQTSMSSSSGGDLKVTGYNVMWYLMRNKDSVMLEDETATSFIKRTAAYYGIPLGNIMETGVTLEREPFINRTIWDMWVSALSYTRDLNSAAKFLLQEKEGKIELVNRTPPGAVWEFHRGFFIPGPESWNNNPGNIFTSTNNFSMENYANVVRVYKGGAEGEGSSLLEGGAGTTDMPFLQFQYPPQQDIQDGKVADINRYGMFLESVDLQMPGEASLDLGNASSNAQQQGMKLYTKLNKVENTGSFTSFNINTLRPGDQVHVRDDITGLVGKYYVKSGNHTVTDTETSMTITVNIEDALPEEYAARAQRPTKAAEGLLGPAPVGPNGSTWTTMSGSVSIPDRYALAVAAGFKTGEEALKMTTISLYECGNCNMAVPNATMDVGLWQINQVHWSTYGGPEVMKNPRNNAQAAFGVWSGRGGGENGYKAWHVYPDWNGPGTGTPQSAFDAKMAEVAALVRSAGTTAQTGWAPIDGRGKLPTYSGDKYTDRNLAGILGVTLHYTAGPPSQSVYEVAQYQTSAAASGQTGTGRPFPGLAYTLFVEADGKTTLAWDLTVACWHNAAQERNRTHVGICYAGNVAPTEAQITSMAQAIGYCQKIVGRQLAIEGHKDTYQTECPGPQWPGWKQTVMSRIPPSL